MHNSEAILDQITDLLKQQTEIPIGILDLGLWLYQNLSYEDIETLAALELTHGVKEANKLLVKAMVASGKYSTEDNEVVHKI